MLRKKICLCLLMVSMASTAAPDLSKMTWSQIIDLAKKEAVYEGIKKGVMLPIAVLLTIAGKKMFFDAPDSSKHQRLVAIQKGRIITSKHLAEFIKELSEKKGKEDLTDLEEKQLKDDIDQRYIIEQAIRKSGHQFEKPSKELQTTGWFYRLLRPAVEALP